MRLGARIVVLAVLLVGVANFLSLSVVALSLRSGLVAELQADIAKAERVLFDRLETDAAALQGAAAVLATGDVYTPVGTARIDENWEVMELDLLVVQSPAGRVQVWPADVAGDIGEADLPGVPSVTGVGAEAMHVVSVPTPGGGRVSVGRRLDDAWIAELATATDTEIALSLGGNVVAAAMRSVRPDALVTIEPGSRPATIEGVPLVAKAIPMPRGHARFIVAVNESQAFAQYYRTMMGLVIVGILTVVASGAVATSLASWLVAPIRQVTTEAERIARVAVSARMDDEDSDVVIADSSLLEAARMADSLRTIINELREAKSSLEGQLAAKHEALGQARRAEAAKQNFLANMSHELRTPLNAVIGYTEMIREDCTRGGHFKLVGDLERVLSSSHYLLDLIDDILALTQIEAGKMEIEPSAFQLGPIIRDVVAGIRPVAAKHANRLVMDVDDVGSMFTDRSKVRQLVRNLVSNGAKFTTDGEVHVHAHRESSADGDEVIIVVRDTGIGMTPEQIRLVFKAFVQADDSATRRYEGSGLGLSICHLFCEMLQGTLEVQSEVDEGTTFTVRLPAKLSL